jgi:PIN domain nuclease of toxin-antitoxin system
MRLFLDTQVFLWYISGDERLPMRYVNAIRLPGNDVFLSAVSLWEAIIKYDLGELPLPQAPTTYLPTQRRRHAITSLPVY